MSINRLPVRPAAIAALLGALLALWAPAAVAGAASAAKALNRDLAGDERYRIVSMLHANPAPEAEAALITIATDPSEHHHLRSAALAGIGARKPEAAVEPLLQLLKNADEHWVVRSGSAMALARMQAPAALPVIEAELENPNPYLRAAMVSAVEEYGDKAADVAPVIIRMLETDADYKVRRRAAEAMWKFGAAGRAAIPALRKALHDKDPQVGVWAAFSLRYMAIPGEGPQRAEYVEALAEALRTVKDEDDRRGLINRLGELGASAAPALPVLIETLRSADRQQVVEAARTLGRIGAPEAIGPLIDTLRHPYDAARATAATSLGGLKAEAAVPALAGLLKDGSDLARTAALHALRAIGTPEALRHTE